MPLVTWGRPLRSALGFYDFQDFTWKKYLTFCDYSGEYPNFFIDNVLSLEIKYGNMLVCGNDWIGPIRYRNNDMIIFKSRFRRSAGLIIIH